jgi:hypothetical protein
MNKPELVEIDPIYLEMFKECNENKDKKEYENEKK